MPTMLLDGAIHHIANHRDTSPPYNNVPIYLGGNPDGRRCSCCFLGFSHSQAKHTAHIEHFEQNQREYAGQLARSEYAKWSTPPFVIYNFLSARGWQYAEDSNGWNRRSVTESLTTLEALLAVARGEAAS